MIIDPGRVVKLC